MDDFAEIIPLFGEGDNENSLVVHKNISEIITKGKSYQGNASVVIDLLPYPSLHIYGRYIDIPQIEMLDIHCHHDFIRELSVNGKKVEGIKKTSRVDMERNICDITWVPSNQPIIGLGSDETKIKRITFHLFDFKEFSGTESSFEGDETRKQRFEHILFDSEDIKMQLKSLVETNDNIKKMNSEGICLLTHVGTIEKTDGEAFTGKQASEYLTELASFFSFARGKRCNPVFAVGFDDSHTRVWESWSSPTSQHGDSFPSWFDPSHGEQLVSFFKGFHRKWKDDTWRDTLREAIYWYLNSNIPSKGIDIGIILTQTAIERLSFQFSVEHKKLLTAETFKSLRAADKFRILFASLGLPLDISDHTPKLKAKAKKFQWENSPHALTEIRNSIVHPEHKRRGQFDDLIDEVWNLGLWYLEISILVLCDYKGTYANRMEMKKRFVGQVENFTW